MSKNVLLVSVQTIKDRSGVHLNADDKLILPEIKAAQDESIVPAIGTALFEKLQTGVAGNSLTVAERTLLDDYITDTLINFVLAALPMSSSYQFFTKGVLRKTAENTELPTMSDMVELSNWYKNRAEFYRERLIRYISLNRSTYPLYDDLTGDIQPSSSGYTLPCWLGDDDERC